MGNISRVLAIFMLVLLRIFLLGHLEAQVRRISSDKFFGCTEKTYFEKLVVYFTQKNMNAFTKGLSDGVYAGLCTLFKSGDEVFVIDTAISSDLIKIRRKGEVAEYWTNVEAIK